MGLQNMKARVVNGGSTLLEEQIKDAQESLEYSFCDDVSYNPNMVFYKTETPIPIKMYNQEVSASYGTVSAFLTTYNNPLELGQVLHDTKSDEYWLCVESYNINDIHYKGALGKCMRWLRWQDDNGIIQEFPIIVMSASKYNTGERGDEVLSIGSDQLMVFAPLNDDTIKLDRGKKFFIDEKKDNPTTYELTRTDTALYTFMGKGFMSMILSECAYAANEDDLKYGVCNYISPIAPPENGDETTILSGGITGVIHGNKNLKVGFERTYTASLTDEDGNAAEWSDDYSWNIVSNFEVTSTVDSGSITLFIDDEDYIDYAFGLQVLNNGGQVIAQIEITVIGIF